MIVTIHEARQHLMACMEAGDEERASTLLTEFEALYPEHGAELRDEVLDAYRVLL